MDNNLNKRAFRPVYGTESKILNADLHEGYVYVASDSGKIFLDAADPEDIEQIVKRKQIGGSGSGGGSGSTGLYWADGDEEQGTIVKATEDADDGDPVYYFSINAIEGGALPDKDALILNADGRFFRVTDNVLSGDGLFTVELIAVSGGGSGGGGGGGPAANSLTATWSNIDYLGSTYIYGKDVPITFYPHSDNADTISVQVIARDKNNQYPDVVRTDRILNDTPFTMFNANLLPPSDNIEIELTLVDGTYNGSKGKKYTLGPIKVLKMYLEKPANVLMPIQQGQASLGVIPYFTGLGTTENPVRIFYSIDDGEATIGKELIAANDQAKQLINIPRQEHGMHTIDLWLSVVINATEYDSDIVTYEVPWIDNTNEMPVIWLKNELGTIVNYEEAVIEYMVYDTVAARQGSAIEVSLYHGTDLLNTEQVTYNANQWLQMDLTANYTVGNNTFNLVCGMASKEISFYVTTEGARDLSLRYTDQLEMNFDALGRSSKEIKSSRSQWISSVKAKTTIGPHNGIPYEATLSDFNWYSNGWKNDNDGNGSYLSLANGASVAIPIDDLSLNDTYSWTFEIRFRVRNAKKFATLVTEIPKYRYYDAQGNLAPLGEEKTLEEIEDLGGTLMYDEDGNPVMNEANTTKKIVRDDKYIAFKYLNANKEGFAIGTQEAYFNTSGGTVNVKYKEDEIINISFVFDKPNDQLSIYLNGILSGVTNLTTVNGIDMFNTAFLINSEYCDFDLYKLRVYPLALSMPDIIHNYIADIKNIDIFDENDLTDVNDDTKLSYEKLLKYNKDHPDSPTMPYAVIDMSMFAGEESDLPCFKGDERKCNITFVNPVADYLLASEQITPYQYYTHCPSFTAEGVDINVQGTSSQKYPRRNFKTKFKGAGNTWVYTQGELKDTPISGGATLSSGDKISKKWHMDSEKLGVNKFTWKIDYMESSGSYNTGFANLMGTGIYGKHPLQDLNIDGLDASIYRTSVYGFPMLVFHKTAEKGYTYIGRYNLNLDKSANERYGFEESVEQPYVDKAWEETAKDGSVIQHAHPYIADVAECWELRDNQDSWCSWKYPSAAARSTGFMTKTTTDQERIEAVAHFEARYHKDADPFEYAQNIILNKPNDGVKPEDAAKYVQKIGGSTPSAASVYCYNKLKNLEILFNWLDSTNTDAVTNISFDTPKRMLVSSRLSKQIANPEFDYMAFKENPKTYPIPEFLYVDDTEAMEENGVTYETETTSGGAQLTYGIFTKDSVEYRRQKFYSEFDKHLDKEYCGIYFVMTELLLCYDSRGKNMMIATFGPREAGGDYIWYPIFYDIDTQLGLNNVGAKLWDYNEDNTENGTFSTKNSVLWTNFYDVFKDYVIQTYANLRQSKINYNSIENSYMCRAGATFNSYAMQGKRPIIAIGLDAYYKYVLPTIEPWKNQEGKYQRANYLYACQGDRILSRELLINNRLLYMDSKYQAGTFTISRSGMSGMNFRVTANKPSTTSDKYLESDTVPVGEEFTLPGKNDVFVSQPYPYKYFDATPEYYVTPYLDFYITTFIDEIPVRASEAYNEAKYPNGMPTYVSESALSGYKDGRVDQQLNYFAGSAYISSLGDLSTKYATEMHFPNTPRLLDITLGSDIPGYFSSETPNPLEIDAGVDQTGKVIEGHEKPLLEKIILSNMTGVIKDIDTRAASRLREFRALGTKLPYVKFADGAPLDTVHLPNTTTQLIFNQNKNLTRILKSTPVIVDYDATNNLATYRDPSTYEGLFVDGLTNYTPSMNGQGSPIQELSFEGDALGYGSYEILKAAVLEKNSTSSSNRLKIRMADINWSPYVQVEYGEEKVMNQTYYYLTDHSTFEPYTHGDDEWLNDTLNGLVYTYDNTKDESIIPDLSLFQIFLNDMASAEHDNRMNQFTNNISSMSAQRTYPTISGELFVSNADGEVIDEAELTSIYAEAWPNLKIRAAKVNKAYISKFVQRLDSGKDTELDIHRAARGENVHPTMSAKQPTRANYVFRGWTLDPQYCTINEADIESHINARHIYASQSDFDTLTFSTEQDTFIFYAVFSIVSYTIQYLNPDGTLIYEDHKPYGSVIGYELDKFPVFVNYSDNNLASNEHYYWLGWVTEQSDCFVTNERMSKASDLTKLIAQSTDRQYYACYIKEDAKARAARDGFFTFETASRIYGDGWRIIPRVPMYGKVTLPVTYNNLPILEIGYKAFRGMNVTSIYWNGDAQLKAIGSEAFHSCTALTYIEIPETLESIGESAFRMDNALRSFYFPEGLTSIGATAFNQCFTGAIELLTLPSTLTTLGNDAFSYCRWTYLNALDIGNETNGNSLRSIGNNKIFSANASSPIHTIRFYGGAHIDTSALDLNEGCTIEEPGI